jgi:hypothetical protein
MIVKNTKRVTEFREDRLNRKVWENVVYFTIDSAAGTDTARNLEWFEQIYRIHIRSRD